MRVVPPKGAPNILLIMTDDVGFGAPSTFGGVIPTPSLDRIAAMGLRYTAFHTTALCSPTRAALLTGRNHHSVGTGVVVDQAIGYPGYNSIIPRDAVAIGEILKQNGYDTSWYGKDHNVPQWEAEWIKKISDMHLFDKGYNDLREQIIANQKRLGIIPQNAQLTAWPDSIPNWETLSPDAKKLFIRQADVYGAYLAYTDYEIGRVKRSRTPASSTIH
jgi:arylsulfatase A-like enzyme